jgi:glycosyltransferase involved in cell wall biosynthesis
MYTFIMKDKTISVVLPCLNEQNTLLHCIEKAFVGINKSGLTGEVIVADNGSVDNSINIALDSGARVVNVDKKGYGSALNGGISAAKGEYIIMGDSDSTYNFEHIDRFIQRLDEGYDLVVGNRFLGGIEKDAMPFLNKFIGNPVLSFIAKRLFDSDINDFHCGLRAFTKNAYKKMDLRSSGMEFATEMIAKSALLKLKIAEVPTTLSVSISPRTPHLKPFRDGLRHLRLMLTYGFVKLFRNSFNIMLSIFIPIYLITLIFVPFTLLSVELSIGFLNAVENIVLVVLLLKTMLQISSQLFPEFVRIRQIGPRRNFGILYLSIGLIFYLYDFIYWGRNSFGLIDQFLNLKLLSLASLALNYGVIELFRLFIEVSSEYFKKNSE